MTYLHGSFEHDIFVSYAHGRADRQGVKRLKHWSERLRVELQGEIVDLLPEFESLDIFIDRELDPAEPLTHQLRSKASQSGLLLIIMSKHYLNSAWCTHELEWFEAEIKRRSQTSGLVLVVRVQPTDPKLWPSCLKDEQGHVVLGFRFHPECNSDDDLVQPFGWPEPLPQDRAHYEELNKLASIVTQRLRRLQATQELREKALRPRPQTSVKEQLTIYLQAASSARPAWEDAKKRLQNAGYRVLPEIWPAVGTEFAAMQAQRKARLTLLREQAHALVLLRAEEGDRIESELESVASDRAALQAFDVDLPCAALDLKVGMGGTRAHELGVDAVDMQAGDWLQALEQWLRSVTKGSR